MATISPESLNVTHRQCELLRYLLQRKLGSLGEIEAPARTCIVVTLLAGIMGWGRPMGIGASGVLSSG